MADVGRSWVPRVADAPLWGESRKQKWLDSWKVKRGRKGSHQTQQDEQVDPQRGEEWIWPPPGNQEGTCLILMGLGAGVWKRRSCKLADPSSWGQNMVAALNASRTSGAGVRKLTTRSSLESDSELESSPLSRSRYRSFTEGHRWEAPRSEWGDYTNPHFPMAQQRVRPASMSPALTPLELLAFPVAGVPRSKRRVHPQRRRSARLPHGGPAVHCARVRRAPPRGGLL